jgi:hypothetical protein
MKQIYQPETDNQEFWNRIDQMPLDTVKSLQEFWQLIHEPGADYDSGMLEYQHRLDRLNLVTQGDINATV